MKKMIVEKLSDVPKTYSGKVLIRTPKGFRVCTVNQMKSKTDQQWAKDCDTNSIMDRYTKTGQIPHMAKVQGQFADVSQVEDLLPSLLKVEAAKKSFMTLPPKTRTRFGNKIENMIEFLQDPSNDKEAITLGLMTEKIKKPKLNGDGKKNDESNDEKKAPPKVKNPKQ